MEYIKNIRYDALTGRITVYSTDEAGNVDGATTNEKQILFSELNYYVMMLFENLGTGVTVQHEVENGVLRYITFTLSVVPIVAAMENYLTLSETTGVEETAIRNLVADWEANGLSDHFLEFRPFTGSDLNHALYDLIAPHPLNILGQNGVLSKVAGGLTFNASSGWCTGRYYDQYPGAKSDYCIMYKTLKGDNTQIQNVFVASENLFGVSVDCFQTDNATLRAYPNIFAGSTGIVITANDNNIKTFRRLNDNAVEFWRGTSKQGTDNPAAQGLQPIQMRLNRTSVGTINAETHTVGFFAMVDVVSEAVLQQIITSIQDNFLTPLSR
jgi:hypothetical protein